MQTITTVTFTSVPEIDVNIGVSSAKKHPSNMLTTQQRDPYVGSDWQSGQTNLFRNNQVSQVPLRHLPRVLPKNRTPLPLRQEL